MLLHVLIEHIDLGLWENRFQFYERTQDNKWYWKE